MDASLHFTTIFHDFLMDFPRFSRIFQDFFTSWCHRHVLQAWILGNRATFAPDRANDKKLLAKATINADTEHRAGVLMCSDVFCSYTSYHFIHVWEILRFPKRPKMVTFCRGNATFATFCCCECCGQFCRCTARGRGQAGDEDASTGSQGKTTGKLRHKDRAHSFRQKTKRCSRDDPKMKERTSKKYHKVDLGN